jgi:hypothetical protein
MWWNVAAMLTWTPPICDRQTANLSRRVGPSVIGPGPAPDPSIGAAFKRSGRSARAMSKKTSLPTNDFRSNIQRFQLQAMDKHQAFVDFLKRVANNQGATPAQIALAWLLAQRPFIVAIPGTTKFHRLEENPGAADVQLTDNDLRQINDAASQIEARRPLRARTDGVGRPRSSDQRGCKMEVIVVVGVRSIGPSDRPPRQR